MKKVLFLLVLLVLTVAIVGCAGGDDTTADNTADTTTDTVMTTTKTTTDETTTAGDETPDEPVGGNDFTNSAPDVIIDKMIEGVEGLTIVKENLSLKDKDTFQYHFFVDLTSSVKSATIAQPIIGTIPFFVGILKVNTAKEAESLAKSILDNVDYNKLICAQYKKAYTRAVGNTVVVVLDGDIARADSVIAVFDSLAAS